MLEIFRPKLVRSSRTKDSCSPMNFLQTSVRDGGSGGGGGGGDRYLKEETAGEEDVELSLGLSLNGRFGVEPRRVVSNSNYDDNNRLIRASSVADFLTFPSAGDPTPMILSAPLTRTCSLPAETAEEWKKRKEFQSLRRSEAKRKRVEKLKNDTKRRNFVNGSEFQGSSPSSLLPPLPRLPPIPSLVSVGSTGSGGSSGISDLESQPFSGLNKDTELKSTASQQSILYQIPGLRPYISDKANVAFEHSSNKALATSSKTVRSNSFTNETLKAMFADMPCVSTKGDGVNGKKIEGFLYRYRKGEEVRIVCVCHGSFLTPAEFVKHSGSGSGGSSSGDVEHPLRHIVVYPPSL